MLSVDALNQYYGESHTLWDVTLNVGQGSCVCLMGRNGVGKTTLLQSIMGLLPVKSGDITYSDSQLAGKIAEERAQLGIGYVPQGRDIFPLLTVEENLQVGLSALGRNTRKIPARIFELFPVLKEMLHRRGGDLSGGQQQQLAIGRALALEPKLLLLDEPTEGIQPNIVSQIGDVITQLNREDGISILLVEQKLQFARRIGREFALMDKGRIVAKGPMSDLSDDLVKEYLTV